MPTSSNHQSQCSASTLQPPSHGHALSSIIVASTCCSTTHTVAVSRLITMTTRVVHLGHATTSRSVQPTVTHSTRRCNQQHASANTNATQHTTQHRCTLDATPNHQTTLNNTTRHQPRYASYCLEQLTIVPICVQCCCVSCSLMSTDVLMVNSTIVTPHTTTNIMASPATQHEQHC